MTLQGSKVHNVQFYGKHALIHKYVKPTLLQNQQMSSTLNIHSHLFGLVCFLTKREIYKMYISCNFHPNVDLYFLSVDVDSFSVIISDENALRVVETFCANSDFDYKVEADNINVMICYSNVTEQSFVEYIFLIAKIFGDTPFILKLYISASFMKYLFSFFQ